MQTDFKEHERVKRKDKSFTENTKELFRGCHNCHSCGVNGWDAGHHIIYTNYFPESDSPLNFAPLHNSTCHIGGGHHFSEAETNKFLILTLRYLYFQGYQLTKKDYEFIKKFKKRYESTEEGKRCLQLFK